MLIAVLNEGPKETRVAITPNTIKKFHTLGLTVACEAKAGLAAGFSDKAYTEEQAQIFSSRKKLLQKADVIVLLNEPTPSLLSGLKPSTLVISNIDNLPEEKLIKWALKNQISLFSMNLIPRISRAQSLDSLSSQANLAGYRAVLEGAMHFKRLFPMMMTAAGMIQPAKVLVLGAGVAGLQAIATAKRLGAVVYAFDVRTAAKEQVESLGAEFVEVASAKDQETAGGYASEMSEEYKNLQAQAIDTYAKLADIIICTALIPGKKAPILLNKETVEAMKPGSIIVDLATSRGGNCALSVKDKITQHQEVTLIGHSNIAGLVPSTASELYANNLFHLLSLLTKNDTLSFDAQDEIIQQALLCHEGNYLPFFKEKENASNN